MGDIVCRLLLEKKIAVALEFAHRSVGTEEAAGLTLGFDLADAADVKHGPEPRFALAQSGFCGLSPGGCGSKLGHQRVDLGDGSFVQRQRTAGAQGDCSASRVTD